MNRGSQYLRGKEGMLKVLQEERGKPPKEECRYCDLVLRKEVVVYASAENRSYKTIPTGYDY